MDILNRSMVPRIERPLKVIQFGEGNFLRGFADFMIDKANETGDFNGEIAIVKPRPGGSVEKFRRQDCRFTVSLRGLVNGQPTASDRRISCIREIIRAHDDYEHYMALAESETLRFVISNTTEAGIVFSETDALDDAPALSFPAKLTQFLYHRFRYFHADESKGLIMLPVELIDENGAVLKQCVLKYAEHWSLGAAFETWLHRACIFASTLVDRIVTGYPRANEEQEWARLGYIDRLMVIGEPFALWIIESDRDFRSEFPLDRAGLPVLFTANLKPYKQRKVRILNGAHTSFVLASYLMGNDFVQQSMDDGDVRTFMMKTIRDEIIPTLALPEEELQSFAAAVTERFQNPYVKHALLSIALNSVSKWKVRCLPSLTDYTERFGVLPKCLSFSLAALIAFYSGTEIRENTLIGHRGSEEYKIQDDRAVLEFFSAHSQEPSDKLTRRCLSRSDFWGRDLNEIRGLTDEVTARLQDIRSDGMRAALCRIL